MKLLAEVEAQVNRPFSVKLEETRNLIRQNLYDFGDQVAVAFSGGKDSTVVLFLTLEFSPDVLVIFNNTGVEYPETVLFVKQIETDWSLNLITTYPEKSFWQCIKEYGFPKQSKHLGKANRGARCCYWLKEKPALLVLRRNNMQCQFTGQTASESWIRMFAARDFGDCFFSKKWKMWKVHPILWWTEEEVWQFITDRELPINEAYRKGAHRVGCMPCTAYKSWERELRKYNPKLYRFIKLRKDKQFVMELPDVC